MAKTPLLAIGAVLLVAGGAVAGYGVTRKPEGGLTPQASQAMGSAIAQLDGDVKAARATVKERAQTVAALLPVQAVVGTNAETANDMFGRGELKFPAQEGEVIELGQIFGDKVQTLLIQPSGGMHSPRAGKFGSFVDLMGDQVAITEVAEVKPKEMSAGMTGAYAMVVRPLDLKPAIARLQTAGVAGEIESGGKKLSIGSPAAGAVQQAQAIPSLPELKLTVAIPPASGGTNVPAAAGGGVIALLGLILLVAGLLAKSPAVTITPEALAAAVTQLGMTGVPGATTTATPTAAPDAGAGSSTTDLGPGSTLGRWEIIKRLGSGGMADVFLARSRGEAGFEKQVAVKVMHPHLARIPRAVDHFLDEARLASRITHPNVVAIQDLGKIGNDYVIVMEFVDGVDLERLLASARAGQRQVPLDIALGIICRICDGLNAAHKALAADGTPLNIVHRDVKSANVLVSKQGGVKVVDFGIAKASQQGHLTVAGETKGTPSMMAPEQRVGDQVDVRADVYSLAAVAYEILTGQVVNLDLAALAHLGVENWPHLPPPSSMRAQLPPELDGILLKAMSFEREKRPADCAAFEATFEGIMKQYGLTASDKDIARWAATEIAQLSANPAEAYSATAAPS